MKVKTKIIYSLFGIFTMSSCLQNDELPGTTDNTVQEVKELDLQKFTYGEIKNLLGGQEKVENILLKDGDLSKKIAILSQNKNLNLNTSDSENKNKLLFYYGAPEDSVCVILHDEYASINLRNEGEEVGYVIYADPAKNQELIETYNQELPATTRGADREAVTRSTSATAPIRLNFTKGRKLMPTNEAYCQTYQTDHVDSDEAPVSTRTSIYTQWPRGNTLTIHLVCDHSDYPWIHEIGWQVDDLYYSILNIMGDINIKLWLHDFGYRSEQDGYAALYNFKEFCETSECPIQDVAGHDIMVLIRHWGWDYGNGLSNVNTYKISRYNNEWAYGVACTTSWYNRTLAHEVGHILGAVHTDWGFSHWLGWKLYLGYDLMIPTHSWFEWSIHFNGSNRDKIYFNLL